MKTPVQFGLKLVTVVVLGILSKPNDFEFKKSRVSAQGLLTCRFSERCRTHSEDPLPLPIFIRTAISSKQCDICFKMLG